MNGAGYMLRFVDVVLILLFGFISISEIRVSEIQLPESTELDRTKIDREVVVYVGVLRDGTFLVEDESQRLGSLIDLRTYLRAQQARAGERPMRVKYRCSWDTPNAYVKRVAALADQLGISKSLEVKVSGGV